MPLSFSAALVLASLPAILPTNKNKRFILVSYNHTKIKPAKIKIFNKSWFTGLS
jgi:hypothetical protein